jgi:serine/threonine-protein kinase
VDERIGRYQLIRLLAAGGMGEVFLAHAAGPAGFSKTVVIKRILRHLAADSAFVEMFLNEARLAALLTHPNIVQIFELGEESGTYFLVMEYVHGLSLHALTQRLRAAGAQLSPGLAAYICSQALQGIHHAHQLHDASGKPMHIVHRDVTPDNLLVGYDGTVKVADFGIAKASDSLPTTAAGMLKGKFAYLSPEQIQNVPVDGRADVFSMGVVLYKLLTGHLPFGAAPDAAVLHAILHNSAPDVRSTVPDVAPELAEVVQRALAKEPSDRYPSAEAMQTALEAYLATSPDQGTRTGLRRYLGTQFPEQAATVVGPSGGLSETSLEERPVFIDRTLNTGGMRTDPRVVQGRRRARSAFLLGVLLSVVFAAATASAWAWRENGKAKSRSDVASVSVPPPQPSPAVSVPVMGPAPHPSDGPAAVHLETAPGSVDVRVNPWAEVYLNGRRLGVTPMRPIHLPPGHHTLTLRNPELKLERKVNVTVMSGERTVLKADLLE